MFRSALASLGLLALLAASTTHAQQASVAPAAGVLAKGAQTGYGPILFCAVEIPGPEGKLQTLALNGLLIRLGDTWICFDTVRLTLVGAWPKAVLDFKKSNLGTYKGLESGAVVIREPVVPNLPQHQSATGKDNKPGRWRGVRISGSAAVLEYEIDGRVIREHYETGDGWLRRWIQIDAGAAALSIPQSEHTEQGAAPTNIETWTANGADGKPVLGAVDFVVTTNDEDPHTLTLLAAATKPVTLAHLWHWGDPWTPEASAKAKAASGPDFARLAKTPAANWPQTITTQGTPGTGDAAYVADTIPLPEENPWKCWIRPTGLDFFPDGRLAICTLGGDVWIAANLDAALAKVAWRRFAGGLREPMGLRIVNGKIHVGCRDGIIRLHDDNSDGEADFYECLNSGRTLVANFHAFAYDLQTDRAGNFYYGTGGNQLGPDEPWHGKLFRVSANGSKLDAVASGFRAPNGLTVGPDDAVYVAENQGQWIPSSKISRIKPGGFYGFVADPNKFPKAKGPAKFDPPICYLPMAWDNSSGGGVFCENDQWGPFRGRMLHTSFGAAALFAVFEQRVGEVSQAAVAKLPLKSFESGIHRARFNPADGQLFVCGIKGWQSKAVQDGCLARVRYTGKPVRTPTGFRVAKDAVVIEFATPVDPAAAADTQNYAAEQWNYLWHATYGSPDVSVADPKKRGRDSVEIRSAKVSADGKAVTLEIPGLAPVMQMLIKMNIKSADGTAVETELAATLNAIPE